MGLLAEQRAGRVICTPAGMTPGRHLHRGWQDESCRQAGRQAGRPLCISAYVCAHRRRALGPYGLVVASQMAEGRQNGWQINAAVHNAHMNGGRWRQKGNVQGRLHQVDCKRTAAASIPPHQPA